MLKLPLNCSVEYTEVFLSKQESMELYEELLNLYKIESWKTQIEVEGEITWSDTGKIMFIDRDLFEANKFPEAYWGKTEIWSKKLERIKERVEKIAKRVFNVCVCIYYPNGDAGVDYHSDYIAFGDTSLIPSISLGEERAFCLREKETFDVFKIVLKEGSLLIMGENCQERYEHSLPIDSQYKNGRINLTFRQYGFK